MKYGYGDGGAVGEGVGGDIGCGDGGRGGEDLMKSEVVVMVFVVVMW